MTLTKSSYSRRHVQRLLSEAESAAFEEGVKAVAEQMRGVLKHGRVPPLWLELLGEERTLDGAALSAARLCLQAGVTLAERSRQHGSADVFLRRFSFGIGAEIGADATMAQAAQLLAAMKDARAHTALEEGRSIPLDTQIDAIGYRALCMAVLGRSAADDDLPF